MMSSTNCTTLEKELKKSSKLKLSDIQTLKEWHKKQPHLPEIQDVEFSIFLYLSEYHIETTKNIIENYYTYRTHTPEVFSNRDIQKVKRLRDIFKVMPHVVIDKRVCKTKEGYHMMIGTLIDVDTSHFFLNELLNVIFMICDELLWTCGAEEGLIYIIDGAHFTLGHVGHFNLTLLKKSICYTQDITMNRLKGFHLLNMSPAAAIIFNMIKPLFNAKFINRIHIHSTLQSANKYFPIEALPNELGGKGGAIQELMDIQFKKLENFREWFLEDEKYKRVNESLRIGESRTSSDLFGIDGSFKKIDFD